jgi:transcription elongation factor Elf1
MDYEREMASLKCSSCGEGFQAPMNHLTEPVDVWHEWLDECDKEDH